MLTPRAKGRVDTYAPSDCCLILGYILVKSAVDIGHPQSKMTLNLTINNGFEQIIHRIGSGRVNPKAFLRKLNAVFTDATR
jgi:hypothetical protein